MFFLTLTEIFAELTDSNFQSTFLKFFVYFFADKMEDYKFLFKVVLIGNSGVGKTCLVRRFTQGVFPKGQGATIGVDFMIKTLEIDNGNGQREAVKLQIWDTGKTKLTKKS